MSPFCLPPREAHLSTRRASLPFDRCGRRDNPRSSGIRWVLAWIALVVVSPNAWAGPAEDHFENTVRPLLASQCAKCHDDKKQQGGLRLDSRAALLKGGESGPAILLGKVEESLLIRAVRHTGELKMPSGKKLPAEQIAHLERWVREGAVWPGPSKAPVIGNVMTFGKDLWSLKPVRQAAVPENKNKNWAKTDIDRFILAKLERSGLSPVADADRRTLLRRVTLDLTGLPPTPQEIGDFLFDNSPGAFAKVIDRLLDSPRYGERWGRHWLDVARYADTAGDGADYPTPEAYRYRDWVIDAIQTDMPYDQFIRQQIAGDLLNDPSSPQYAKGVVATGFLAVGKRYGYAPNADFQHLDIADLIESVGRSVLGLSLGCARCHDHKYDPVSMRDYYAMYGIFQSSLISFPGGEEHKQPANLAPLVPPSEAKRLDEQQSAKVSSALARVELLQSQRAAMDGTEWAGGPDLGFESQAAGKPPDKPWLAMGANTISPEAQSPFAHIHPPGKQGVRMAASVPNDGIRMVLPRPMRKQPDQSMHLAIDFRTLAEPAQPGACRFYFGRGVIESTAIDFSLSTNQLAIRQADGWKVIRTIEPGVWHTLAVTLHPATGAIEGVVGKPGDLTPIRAKTLPNWDGVIDTFICDGLGHQPGKVCTHDLDNITLSLKPLGSPGGPMVRKPTPSQANREQLGKIDADLVKAKKELETVSAQKPYAAAYAVAEGKAGNARIQLRGEPDKLSDEVPRRFLEILGGEKISTGSGRKDLARWLTDPANPLTARVMVNRVWQWHFGQGLAATASDFGTRGEEPSHPELLDHLAGQFMREGWSLKSIHRMVLLSHVYQLSSDPSADLQAKDPANRLLGHFQRRPLDAETLRDQMLFVSGTLDLARPGRHPFPPEPTWGFTIHNPFHAVYDSNHRSVYLMSQRNRRHPYLALFDGADPNLSSAGRLATTTPTQALFLMNSPQVHHQAETLAKRLLATPGDSPARIRLAVEMTTGHPPGPEGEREMLAFLKDYSRKHHLEKSRPQDVESEAWAALCRVLLVSNAAMHLE